VTNSRLDYSKPNRARFHHVHIVAQCPCYRSVTMTKTDSTPSRQLCMYKFDSRETSPLHRVIDRNTSCCTYCNFACAHNATHEKYYKQLEVSDHQTKNSEKIVILTNEKKGWPSQMSPSQLLLFLRKVGFQEARQFWRKTFETATVHVVSPASSIYRGIAIDGVFWYTKHVHYTLAWI
jgi:hypothetical protein